MPTRPGDGCEKRKIRFLILPSVEDRSVKRQRLKLYFLGKFGFEGKQMSHGDDALRTFPRTMAVQKRLAIAPSHMKAGIDDRALRHGKGFAVPGCMGGIRSGRGHNVFKPLHRHVFQPDVATFETPFRKGSGNRFVDAHAGTDG